MPASEATIGLGTTFSYMVGAVPTLIGEAVSIQPPQPTIETADVTHLGSPDGAREFIATLTDGGEAEVTFNFTDAAYATVSTLFAAKALNTFVVTFPDGATETFTGLVTGKPSEAIEVDSVRRFNMPIKVSGLPVYAPAA